MAEGADENAEFKEICCYKIRHLCQSYCLD